MSETYAFTAEAIEPVRLCRFSRPKLRALLDDFPVMERRLLEKAGDQLVAAQEQMLLLGRKTAREKVASFLAGRRRRSEARDASGEELDLPMTRADMADYLGLTVETVSRTCLTQSPIRPDHRASIQIGSRGAGPKAAPGARGRPIEGCGAGISAHQRANPRGGLRRRPVGGAFQPRTLAALLVDDQLVGMPRTCHARAAAPLGSSSTGSPLIPCAR